MIKSIYNEKIMMRYKRIYIHLHNMLNILLGKCFKNYLHVSPIAPKTYNL
jgi:hypothetical protein